MNAAANHTTTSSLDSIWNRNYVHAAPGGTKLGSSNSGAGAHSGAVGSAPGYAPAMNTLYSAAGLDNIMNRGSSSMSLKDQAYGILSRHGSVSDDALSYRAPTVLSTPTPTPERKTGFQLNFGMRSEPSLEISRSYSPQDDYSLETLMADASQDSSSEVIADLKLQVEALTTALMLTSDKPLPRQSAFMQGSTGLEIAHRVMARLKALREENTRLAEIANGTNAAREEAEKLALLKENAELKAHLGELNRRLRSES